MGRASEKPKKVVPAGFPVRNVDYHVVIIKKGAVIPGGWLAHHAHRVSDAVLGEMVRQCGEGSRKLKSTPDVALYSNRYAVYLGPKPNKKWGPVCP